MQREWAFVVFYFAVVASALAYANFSHSQVPVDSPAVAPPAAPSTADGAARSSCTSQSQRPKLSYPKRARAMGVTGTVVVEMRLDAEGVAQNVRVVERRLNKTSIVSADGTAEDVTNIFDAAAVNFAQGLGCSNHASQRPRRSVVMQVPLKFDLGN